MSEFKIQREGWRIKCTYQELKNLYDLDPRWKTDFTTFEDFTAWAWKIKKQVDKIEYLIARERKNEP